MWQVITESLSNKNDKTRISLLFANVSPSDILLKEELDKLAKENPGRFKVNYTVDKATPGWNGFSGYVNAEMYSKANLPQPGDKDVIVFVCGPPGMMNATSGPKAKDKSQGEVDPNSLLGKFGFRKDQVFKF